MNSICLYIIGQTEINRPNCNVGYRQMWRIIQDKYNYVVKRYEIFDSKQHANSSSLNPGNVHLQVYGNDVNENYEPNGG